MQPYYEKDGITIYCCSAEDYLEQFGWIGLDLIFTDPPWGIDGGRGGSRSRRKGRYAYSSGQWEDTPEYIRDRVIPLLTGGIERVGRAVITPGKKMMMAYPQYDDMGGFWHPSGQGYGPWGPTTVSPIFYYGKDPRVGHSPPSGLTYEGTSFENDHPCAKPLRSWTRLLRKCSLEGETVIDPYMGAGTTLVAAKILGRKAVGVEIEEQYCRRAVEKLQQEVLWPEGIGEETEWQATWMEGLIEIIP